MPDISLAVTLSRTLLSLPALNLNDYTNYYFAGQNTPGAVSWVRNQVSSPYVDDDFTVSRRRGKVMESLLVEVLGSTQTALRDNLAALVNAVVQDTFILTVSFAGVSYAWACESADYQVIWSGPRMVARQVQMALTIPRSPVPSAGAF